MLTKSAKARMKSWLLSSIAGRLPHHTRLSYSQFGEDIALATLLRYYGVDGGFYLDVGAYHPVWLSNTYALYQQGWSGITVEPNSGSTDEFRATRPRDIHLNCCVSPLESAGPVTFYSFGPDSVYNTLSEEQAREHAKRSGQPFEALPLPSLTINRILEAHLTPGKRLDVLCIDCEGVDEAILRSLDWARYKPSVIVFEEDGISFDQIGERPMIGFLHSHGYSLFAKIGASFIARLPRDQVGQPSP